MKTNHFNTRALKIAALLFVLGCIYQKVNQPLPDDFEQPWKYRLICFGADITNYFVRHNNSLKKELIKTFNSG